MRGVQLAQYLLQHYFGLTQDVIIPETDHAKALGFEPGCSLRVARGTIRMLPAIQFDDEFLLEADEVHDIGRYRMLPAKFETGKVAISKELPKAQLCVG